MNPTIFAAQLAQHLHPTSLSTHPRMAVGAGPVGLSPATQVGASVLADVVRCLRKQRAKGGSGRTMSRSPAIERTLLCAALAPIDGLSRHPSFDLDESAGHNKTVRVLTDGGRDILLFRLFEMNLRHKARKMARAYVEAEKCIDATFDYLKTYGGATPRGLMKPSLARLWISSAGWAIGNGASAHKRHPSSLGLPLASKPPMSPSPFDATNLTLCTIPASRLASLARSLQKQTHSAPGLEADAGALLAGEEVTGLLEADEEAREPKKAALDVDRVNVYSRAELEGEVSGAFKVPLSSLYPVAVGRMLLGLFVPAAVETAFRSTSASLGCVA
ncbi:Tuberous sclerosis 2 protein [Ceratobasidium theobromae]|uniref:Tuberous sclerosis 2 protein n=1 Tax=Ceratobasidium theobromae TaxID=1582974 RepID=A0A5N5QLC4_9AGAM|nr:Tuberous sclerosis 2 protein [Ceratobasidium theobromae]